MAKAAPTKGNLLAEKKKLALAKMGYELLDKKRNILIREMMQLIGRAGELHEKIGATFGAAYSALQRANVTEGIRPDLAAEVPADDSLRIRFRSVMGVEIPIVNCETGKPHAAPYSLSSSNSRAGRSVYSFFGGQAAFRADGGSGQQRIPSCGRDQKNAETRPRASKYHHSGQRADDSRNFLCARRKGAGGICPYENY